MRSLPRPWWSSMSSFAFRDGHLFSVGIFLSLSGFDTEGRGLRLLRLLPRSALDFRCLLPPDLRLVLPFDLDLCFPSTTPAEDSTLLPPCSFLLNLKSGVQTPPRRDQLYASPISTESSPIRSRCALTNDASAKLGRWYRLCRRVTAD